MIYVDIAFAIVVPPLAWIAGYNIGLYRGATHEAARWRDWRAAGRL